MNEEETKKTLWEKLPIKVKLAIVGIVIGFFFIVIFLVVMITPLMELDIIDIGIGGGNNEYELSYSDINSTSTYWWPIGSMETERINGVTVAKGLPVPTTISSYFGKRKDPYSGKESNHSGVDIAANDGSVGTINIISAKEGTVIYPAKGDPTNCQSSTLEDSCGGGYGNYVMIEHSDGKITLYAHMAEGSITVTAGNPVMQGQVIGKMGSSGRSTGSHLHFEVRVNGNTVDGLNYVSEENPRPITYFEEVVEGTDNKNTVCLTLKNQNYSQNGVIAIMTNINYESSFIPTQKGDYQSGKYTSYGICQWHNERWDNLKNTFPDTYATLGGQLSFLTYELKNNYNSLYSELISGTKEESDLTYDFCREFERPKDTELTCQDRAKNASKFTNYVKNNCG